MNIRLPAAALSGRFRMVVSQDAECKQVSLDTGEFPNLIVNTGMNSIGQVVVPQPQVELQFEGICGRFVVGSGQATPAFTDTALQAPVAFAPGEVTVDAQSSSHTRGWYELSVRYQFGKGVAAGNLSEIGIQRTSASGPLWSRALILDSNGDPTTITVLENDYLTCFYTLRVMIPQEDTTFNIGVDYDGVIIPTTVVARPLRANSSDTSQGWGFKSIALAGTQANLLFFTGGLASPTSLTPLGTRVGNITNVFSQVPYIQDSYERFITRTSGLNDHNGTELRTAQLNALMGCWQLEFNPPLEKDDTQEMEFTFGYSWARA